MTLLIFSCKCNNLDAAGDKPLGSSDSTGTVIVVEKLCLAMDMN